MRGWRGRQDFKLPKIPPRIETSVILGKKMAMFGQESANLKLGVKRKVFWETFDLISLGRGVGDFRRVCWAEVEGRLLGHRKS